MNRDTIDYGFDLGTCNSEVARLHGTEVEVFRNTEGLEYTPSAVWLDKQGNLVVGRVAKEAFEREPGTATQSGNAFVEFKRDMGSRAEYQFARSGRRMRPEDLSAEVLKSLRADVERRTGEVITAAVITVPADFDLPACEATQRAAQAAGIGYSILLQEPVAAAQAYSFDREVNRTFWLVYDLGGGTFDAAIIQVRDGMVQVVGHGGDNHLGGKNIDWAIVEKVFIPLLALERVRVVFSRPSDLLKDAQLAGLAEGDLLAEIQASSDWTCDFLSHAYEHGAFWGEFSQRIGLSGFRREAKNWVGAIAKLKIQAEAAKIRLSSAESTEVFIDFLCNDDRGRPVEFNVSLTRGQLRRLAAPFIQRSVNICRDTLERCRLASKDIAKVILVGGPTLMPFLRDQLKSSEDGLGIPLEFNVDPLTVVARGAAIFAGGQRMPDDPERRRKVEAGSFSIRLDYNPVGPDTEPPVAGGVCAQEGLEMDFSGYTLEIRNMTDPNRWASGRIGLGAAGNFLTTVYAVKGLANRFELELRDPTGVQQKLGPDAFQITVKGAGEVQITLPHGIGVALQGDDVAGFLEAGAAIPGRAPLRKRRKLRTAVALGRGAAGQLLRVPVVEGNRSRASRNRLIGVLSIPGKDEAGRDRVISRDVPIGSVIEVTLEIDQSRLIRTRAFLEHLGEEYEGVLTLEPESPDADKLLSRLTVAKERLQKLRERADAAGSAKAASVIQRVDKELLVSQVAQLIPAASTELDAARQCQNLLNSLESSMDDAEDALEWPELVAQAEEEIGHTRKMFEIVEPWDDAGRSALKGLRQVFEVVERETRESIEQRLPDLLRRRIKAVSDLGYDVKRLDPAWWGILLRDLKDMKGTLKDSARAEALIQQGDRAIQANDVRGLQESVRGLISLLPAEEREHSFSGVTL